MVREGLSEGVTFNERVQEPFPLEAQERCGGWCPLPRAHTWPASDNSPGFSVDLGQLSREGQAGFQLDRWSRETAGCPPVALFPDSLCV